MTLKAPNDLPTLRNYYAQISMVDDGVGQIMSALDTLGIAENTLFIFTADHGLSTGHHGFWGHGAATYPSNLHRAAHSVPLIVRHGPSVTAGERSQVMVSNMDVFSTILDYTGQSQDQGDCAVPSRSLKSLLSGNPKDWGEDAVYSEQEETRVVRTPKWAYFKRFGNAPNHPIDDELFDIEHDPGEIKNLVGDPAYADVRANLEDMLGKFFETYARPQADLWKGGAPLQHSERNEFWRDAWGNDWQPVYDYGQN